ncbi:unnamed protein product, partial [marine sediment metagenome]
MLNNLDLAPTPPQIWLRSVGRIGGKLPVGGGQEIRVLLDSLAICRHMVQLDAQGVPVRAKDTG